ncbi:MAG: helix-turn-helix transcriptional regulator [Bacteroidaceae bacterium]|nr:helix-turn-helix transcriptional regulator [Bacteroidaceae bacterium]
MWRQQKIHPANNSPAHLSSQFKQVTGMTPKEFRALGNEGRTPLDAL